MRASIISAALFAILGRAAPTVTSGFGHGYTNGNGSPANCPTQVPTYTSNSARMYAIYVQYCESFLYPNNLIQVKAVNSTLFNPNIQGRVDITSTFDGAELNTEYIYGLFANLALNPSAVNLLAVPISYEIRSFIASGDFLSASIIVQFHNEMTNLTTPVLLRSNLMIDECDKIIQYDSVFERTDWYLNISEQALKPLIAAKLHLPLILVTDDVLQLTLKAELANSICSVADQYCTGDNKVYNNKAECLLFMATLPIGHTYEFGGNTLGCRNLHQNMVPSRPSVHCPHLSRTGGGMCVQRDYNQVTLEEYFKVPMIVSA